MGLGSGTTRGRALAMLMALGLGVAVTLAGSAVAQMVTLAEPPLPLLPKKFGDWKRTATVGATPGNALVHLSPQELAECGERRSKVAEYARNGRIVHVEAMEFGDRTGAYSAFTLALRPGMTLVKPYDAMGSVGNGGEAVLFTVGKTVVLADFNRGGTAADLRTLKPLEDAMPKVFDNSGVAPILPSLVPAKGLVQASLRYALGPATYAAEGGVLPAESLDWKMEPEAVTARYDDTRGKETLTLLMYPTPTIAVNAAKVIRQEVPELKASTQWRQSGTLVVLATGSFPADAAEQMVAGVHLSQMTFNQNVQLPFKVVAAQTFTLLENIAILSGVLCTATVLLGLFLGLGRAWFRVLMGKPAAIEPEFLSLHLSPQNKPAVFHRPDSREDV